MHKPACRINGVPSVDRTLLHPVLDTCRQQLAQAGIRPTLRTVLAGSGYVSEENFARAGTGRLRLLAPLAKDPARRHRTRARNLDRLPATARTTRRLRHPRGRHDCKMRARTVEPVPGQLKTCQKLTMMSRRVRVRKRMAARLRRAQPPQAPPSPPDRLTVTRRPSAAQEVRRPKIAAAHPAYPRSKIHRPAPHSLVRQAELCANGRPLV
jgi:hypothetical protein